MKILYIANIRLPTEKAHGIQIMKMCEAFAQNGAQVELVVPWRFNKIKEDPFEYYKVKHVFEITRIPSLDTVKLGHLGFWIQVVSFSISMFLYVLFQKTDVVYSRDELPLWFLSFIKKNLVWEAHTPRYNFIIASLLKRILGLVVISGGLKNFYEEKGAVVPSRVIVERDGVDLDQFSPMDVREARSSLNLPQERKIIGYVGKYKTMGKGKGVDELIEAFAAVSARVPGVMLLLVGINNDERKELIEKLHLATIDKKSYNLVGHVPQPQVPLYLSASDVLVMNYPDAEHYALYMSPMKLFEYMAVKRPIISTDLPSVREVLDDQSAYFVPPSDAQALSRAIELVFRDVSAAHVRATSAFQKAGYYSWKHRAQRILSLFRQSL
ncbi:glycosyltransferase family 4 protein [Candidatus Kaiserbacteria bacterium]|nr:glycosyltransferase family 4 protein [Candidatus Kaiserbacteria bacterium]